MDDGRTPADGAATPTNASMPAGTREGAIALSAGALIWLSHKAGESHYAVHFAEKAGTNPKDLSRAIADS
jgi:hypothetical protein